jgi:hypothetical protein
MITYQPLKPPKVKIRTIKPPASATDEEDCLERLVYLCPYCASEDVKFAEYIPIYTGSRCISHTLGVIERHTREERYTCKSCGALFEASTSKLHFSWLQFLKIWGGPIVFIILTIIFAQFWDATIDENGKQTLNNWESFLALVCGAVGSIWVIVMATMALMDD